MMIHEITGKAGRYKARKRVGRGKYGARGKQSGRGQKGAGSRSGTATRFQFEGGQMPFFRRIPKWGFTNAPFKQEFWIVNLSDIVAHKDFAKGGAVNQASLIKAGLVRDDARPLKILGTVGEEGVKAKLDVTAHRVSAAAKKLILAGGGKVNELGTPKDKVRGIDRNTADVAPKNQTKKVKIRAAHAAKRAKTTAGKAAAPKEAPAAKGKAKGDAKPDAKAE